MCFVGIVSKSINVEFFVGRDFLGWVGVGLKKKLFGLKGCTCVGNKSVS